LRTPIDSAAEKWIEKALKTGPLLVETWQERVADFSMQVAVSAERVQLLGKGRFWTGPTGSYQGAPLGRWTIGLPQETIRSLQSQGVGKLLDQAALHVGKSAQALGYRGPLGVDAMAVQCAKGLRVQPILEVNPRYTMGRIAMELNRKVRGQGAWFFVRIEQARSAGFKNFSELAQCLVGLGRARDTHGLTQGFWPTNDPQLAQHCLTVLGVDESLAALRSQWENLGLPWPDPQGYTG
jgi:hypothetical protein